MQKKRSKRYREAAAKVEANKKFSLNDAVETLKTLPPVKFDQTVTLSFKLGVDPKQSDQMVRGTCPPRCMNSSPASGASPFRLTTTTRIPPNTKSPPKSGWIGS